MFDNYAQLFDKNEQEVKRIKSTLLTYQNMVRYLSLREKGLICSECKEEQLIDQDDVEKGVCFECRELIALEKDMRDCGELDDGPRSNDDRLVI